MSSVNSTDGNVIHADFGGKSAANVVFSLGITCEVLYADDLVAVSRLTYTVNGEQFIKHIMSGIGV